MSNQTKQLDACLSIKDDHLFIEQCDSVDLVSKFGSPIFVLSEDQLRRRETEEDVFRRDVIPDHLKHEKTEASAEQAVAQN